MLLLMFSYMTYSFLLKSGSETPTRLVGLARVSSGPLGLQAVQCRKVTLVAWSPRGPDETWPGPTSRVGVSEPLLSKNE